VLLTVLILIVRSRCGGGKESDSERESRYYLGEDEALIAKNKGISSSYNISSNRLPNNKLKNYNNIHNSDRRHSQVLIVNPIQANPAKLYKKPTVPDNPHVTIHNNLKSSGTEI